MGKVVEFIIIGVYYYDIGNKYEGEWANNNRHGKGIFINYSRNLLL